MNGPKIMACGIKVKNILEIIFLFYEGSTCRENIRTLLGSFS